MSRLEELFWGCTEIFKIILKSNQKIFKKLLTIETRVFDQNLKHT